MNTKLYTNAIEIDSKTGVPANETSFVAGYGELTRRLALKLGIPAQDLDDAAQNVHMKFLAKNGLQMHDPNKNTKFATMYGKWCSLFLLQERDRVAKVSSRYIPVALNFYKSSAPDAEAPFEYAPQTTWYEPHLEIDSESAIVGWFDQAKSTLEELGRDDLLCLLTYCFACAQANYKFTLKDLGRVLSMSPGAAKKRFAELGKILTDNDLGVQSIKSLGECYA